MTVQQGPSRRAAEALRALGEVDDLTKARIWQRVRQGIEEAQVRRRRRLAGALASAAAAVASVTARIRSTGVGRGRR